MGNCKKCNQPKNPCGCKKPEFCSDCIITLGTKCVVYDSDQNLKQIAIRPGQDMNKVIKAIDNMGQSLKDAIDDAFVGKNIGNFSEVFAGYDPSDEKYAFRTLTGGLGIIVEQLKDFLTIGISPEFLDEYRDKILTLDNLRELVVELLREPWFLNLLKQLLKQDWFKEFILELLNDDRFADVIANLITTYPQIKRSLRDIFISDPKYFGIVLQKWLNDTDMETFMSTYILNLMSSGKLNICDIVKTCNNNTPLPPPTNHPPKLEDFKVGFDNRVVDEQFPFNYILNSYFDVEGDELKEIEILTGSDVRGFKLQYRGNTQDVQIGTVISKNDLSRLIYTAKDVDAEYSERLIIKARAVNDLESNNATITVNVFKKQVSDRCVCVQMVKLPDIKVEVGKQYANHHVGNLKINSRCTVGDRKVSEFLRALDSHLKIGELENNVVKDINVKNNDVTTVGLYFTGMLTNYSEDIDLVYEGDCYDSAGQLTTSKEAINIAPLDNRTIDECLTISNNRLTQTLKQNIDVNTTIGFVNITSLCDNKPFKVLEQTLLNEDGLIVEIDGFEISNPKTINVPVRIRGKYTGTKSTITIDKEIFTNNSVHIRLTILPFDTNPITEDVTIELANRENTVITLSNLRWNDPDGDPVEAVRFVGDTSHLYRDTHMTIPYVSGDELPPSFGIFYKAPITTGEFEYRLIYNVKCNNQWSN